MGKLKGYSIAILLSIALHGLVIAVLLANWQSESKKTVIKPQYIQAELVQLAAKAKAPPKASKPAVNKAAEQRQQAQRQEHERKQAQARREAALQEQQRIEAERQSKIEEERQRQERERTQREAEFAQALQEEQALIAAQQDEQVANSYMQLIQQRLSENWSRPPSARLGMEVLIELILVPTGRIVGVTVIESSDDVAFDLAAQQAAFKAQQFKELQNMDSAIFDKYFRRVKVVFSPEDLRL
jgi:colicin import membrane protein